MRKLDAAGLAPQRTQVQVGDVDAAIAGAAHTVARSYAYHYQGHMPIGPSCAIGDVTANGALVLGNMQDAYGMRVNLSALLGLPENRIRVQYWEGASTFGNSPARFDAGEAAAVMSQLAGAPVRLQFMRWDEHGWDNYGPAILSDMRGGVDNAGNMVALDYTAYGIPSLSMRSDATTQNAGIPLAPYGLGLAGNDQLGHAVRDPESSREREVDAALGHVLQDLRPPCSALPADLLRLRAARR